MGFKKLIKNIKEKVKENKQKADSDKAWKDSIREEAKVEAREEAKDELKKIYKEKEKQKIIKGNNILEGLKNLGNDVKGSGLGSDDKINRLLGKGPATNTGFDSTGKINRVLGGQQSQGTFNISDKILHKKETAYGDVIKENKVVFSAEEQKTKDKNDRIARMLR